MSREFVETPHPNGIANKSGFHELEFKFSHHLEDVYICPHGLEGYCEGIKDSKFNTRCAGPNLSYQNCELYKDFANNPDLPRLIAGVKNH